MSVAKFTIPDDLIASLNNEEISIGAFTEEALKISDGFKKLLQAEIIGDELLAIHGREGGSPEMSNLEVDLERTNYNTKSHKGKIAYKYNIRFFYGCSGIDRTDEAKDAVDFEIDTENQQLIIHIPGSDVRYAADEF